MAWIHHLVLALVSLCVVLTSSKDIVLKFGDNSLRIEKDGTEQEEDVAKKEENK